MPEIRYRPDNNKTENVPEVSLIKTECRCTEGCCMKYLKQLLIITFIAMIGETLNYFIPLPVPGSIYGLVLIFLALNFKIIRLDQVSTTGKYLLEIMPIMFVPPAAELVSSWDMVKGVLLQGTFITCLTTVAGMAVVGMVTQAVIRRDKRKEAEKCTK